MRTQQRTQQRTQERTQPRAGSLDHDVAMLLAATEYDRVVALLAALSPQQWSAPTDCLGWDVRDVAGHLLGMAQMAAGLPEMARQQLASQRRVRRAGGSPLDALTAHQVEKNAHLSTSGVVEAMRRVGPRAARARRRTPSFVRARTLPGHQDVGDQSETWTVGYMLDVILTRDPFLHRVDITRATGAVMQCDAAHEGVIVDDVVREWAERHGAPYDLVLTGAAGGHWRRGEAERIERDAFEFCRVLSGRSAGTGSLAQRVPF
ncbi:MAG: maleylpyruvate isomerase family mycothiol-dependent enzyme [Nocardioidaceae bacterium]